MMEWTVRGKTIKQYDVVQVDYGNGWLDYSTIKDGQDVTLGVRLVREGGGFFGHPLALYRIARGDVPVFEVGGLDDEIRDLLVDCRDQLSDVLGGAAVVPKETATELVTRIDKLV